MSSPFRYFRKHTKVFIATAAVLCIFIFVVGDALNSSSGAGGEDRTGATVATWNGGSLNEAQLGSLVAQRMLVDDFLKRVFVQGGGSTGYDFPSSIPPLLLNSEQMEAIETDVIGTEVMSSLATQAGMTVSDALINHYIEEMGLKNVSQEQIVGILKSIGQHNAQSNEAIVFNMLRKMLLAHFYRRTYADASMVVLPQQRWDDWRSVNERISVEAAVLPVEKFLAEVPEPTDAQLMAFYNNYKDADPGRYQNVGGRELPISDPGFAVPRRVTLQYLLGNLNARTEKLMPSVTGDEIEDYYERNKRRDFTKLGLPGDEAFGASATQTPAEPAASETPAGEDAAKTQAEEEATAPSKPAGEAAETPAEPAAPTAEPAAEPATEPAAPATEEAEEKESSSSVRKNSPFRLAAFQTAPAETEDASEPAENAATESAESSEPAEESAAETPASEAPAAESPATETPAAETAAGETSEAKTASDADAARKEDAEEAVEFEPLDKVREDIRKTIAMDKAVQELTTVMSEAAAKLQAEYNQYGSRVAAAKEKNPEQPKLPKAPAKLADLKWLADQYGLTYEKTTPLTIRELYDTAVGKAGDTAQRVTVTEAAYQSLDLYEPMLAEGMEGDWYLVMKTADVPRKVPEFKEVRDQVAQAWKRAEAAKLAEKKAKELAAEVAKAGTPFDQFFFADRGFEVIKPTAFFSWRNYPVGRAGTGTPPGLSDVPELKNVGPEFMDTAFDLDEKEVVGLLNFDRSAAYVIRLDRRQYTGDELKKLFLEEEGAWPGRIDMMNEHYSMFNSAVEREILEERAGLEFDEDWLKRRAERMQERQN
jgi:hypothetical protein